MVTEQKLRKYHVTGIDLGVVQHVTILVACCCWSESKLVFNSKANWAGLQHRCKLSWRCLEPRFLQSDTGQSLQNLALTIGLAFSTEGYTLKGAIPGVILGS